MEHDGQVELAAVEHVGQMAGQCLHQMQTDIGIALVHGLHERRAQDGRGGGWQADADVTGQARLLRGLDRVVGMAQRQLGLAEERQPGVGGHHAAGAALQQPRGQFAFEPADLLAERGRHHAQRHGRAADAAGFDDANEITKLAQFHGGSGTITREDSPIVGRGARHHRPDPGRPDGTGPRVRSVAQ